MLLRPTFQPPRSTRRPDIATFERNCRKAPRGAVSALTVVSHGRNGGGQHAHQLARTIGDTITVKETQTAHDADYVIIGEAHELTHSATLWKTTWYLEPLPWKRGDADRGKLGQTTVLAY
jgi:hypothetical protein